MPSPYDLSREELAELLGDEPPYRVRQVWDGLHQRVLRPAEMTDLPGRPAGRAGGGPAAPRSPRCPAAVRRRRPDDEMALGPPRRRAGRDRADGVPRPGHRVRLHAGRLRHGLPVLRHRPGRLPAPAQRRARSSSRWRPAMREARPRRLSNVVFMGMGEPLANYDRVWAAVDPPARRDGSLRPAPDALDRRRRAGHPPAGRRVAPGEPGRLAACGQRHAARRVRTDQPALPARRRWPTACADYVEASGRRLSIEWAMIDGVNDRAQRRRRAGGVCPSRSAPTSTSSRSTRPRATPWWGRRRPQSGVFETSWARSASTPRSA